MVNQENRKTGRRGRGKKTSKGQLKANAPKKWVPPTLLERAAKATTNKIKLFEPIPQHCPPYIMEILSQQAFTIAEFIATKEPVLACKLRIYARYLGRGGAFIAELSRELLRVTKAKP